MTEDARNLLDELHTERLEYSEYILLRDALDGLEAERDRWKKKYEKLHAEAGEQIGLTLDIADELDSIKAARDRWKARTEALERAVKKLAPCQACVGEHDCNTFGKAIACTLGAFKPDVWEFDEAKYKEGAE